MPPERILLLSGQNEFLDPRDRSGGPETRHASAFVDAYARMGYDGVYPSVVEADWLQEYSGDLPDFFRPAGHDGFVDTFAVGERTIAVVVYPEPARGPFPTEEQTAWVEQTIAALAAEADLVVGVCNWSKSGEEAYLERTKNLPDILLGGGPGPSHPEMLAHNGRTLWARSFTKGRTVNKITLYEWPDAKAGRTWHLGQNVLAETIVLDGSIRGDAEIDALFHP